MCENGVSCGLNVAAGETDWKVIAVDVNDPLANDLNGVCLIAVYWCVLTQHSSMFNIARTCSVMQIQIVSFTLPCFYINWALLVFLTFLLYTLHRASKKMLPNIEEE